jgi:hypothetical protein
MDWMQWTASLAASLGWPSVVIVFLVLVRKQLAGLAGRIEELTLPGGVSAKFGKALGENRDKVETARLAETAPQASLGQSHARDRDWALAQEFPEAAVMKSFNSIEEAIAENSDKLPSAKGSLFSYVKELNRRGLLGRDMVELFKSLRDLRNLAAHGKGTDRITPGEAAEYQDQCALFVEVLRRAFTQLPKSNP